MKYLTIIQITTSLLLAWLVLGSLDVTGKPARVASVAGRVISVLIVGTR